MEVQEIVLGGEYVARDCQEARGDKVNLGIHMKQIWEEIGFNPTSFQLPSSAENDEENDKPFEENDRFKRVNHKAQVTEADSRRYTGLTIANINLEVADEDIKKFVAEFVSSAIEDEAISIVREKKKICCHHKPFSFLRCY